LPETLTLQPSGAGGPHLTSRGHDADWGCGFGRGYGNPRSEKQIPWGQVDPTSPVGGWRCADALWEVDGHFWKLTSAPDCSQGLGLKGVGVSPNPDAPAQGLGYPQSWVSSSFSSLDPNPKPERQVDPTSPFAGLMRAINFHNPHTSNLQPPTLNPISFQGFQGFGLPSISVFFFVLEPLFSSQKGFQRG
jgi:hypothetical protein